MFIPHSEVQASVQYKTVRATESGTKIGDATFYTRYSSTKGQYCVYCKYAGKKEEIATNKNVSPFIITNGINVYYQYSDGEKSVFCKRNLQKETRKELFVIHDIDCEFAGVYKNKLYYTQGIDPATLYYYNLDTGKSKKVLEDVTGTEQKGKFFLCHGYEGDLSPREVRCYNAKTNKVTVISKKVITYCVEKNKLYYVEYVKNNNTSSGADEYEDYYCRVIKSNMDGSDKKVLTKNIRMNRYIEEITSSYFIYGPIS